MKYLRRLQQAKARTPKRDTTVSCWSMHLAGMHFSLHSFLYRYPVYKYTCINAHNRHGISKHDHVRDCHKVRTVTLDQHVRSPLPQSLDVHCTKFETITHSSPLLVFTFHERR
jgi:hypothetical protein